MLSEFIRSEVEFLVVGAYALAAHGYPRATGDIALCVRADEANAKRVLEALARFGVPLHEIAKADLSQSGMVFQIGVAPVRIDILTKISGVKFKDAWPNRLYVDWDDITVPIIARADLIANKKATGRLKDAADAERLENDN